MQVQDFDFELPAELIAQDLLYLRIHKVTDGFVVLGVLDHVLADDADAQARERIRQVHDREVDVGAAAVLRIDVTFTDVMFIPPTGPDWAGTTDIAVSLPTTGVPSKAKAGAMPTPNATTTGMKRLNTGITVLLVRNARTGH